MKNSNGLFYGWWIVVLTVFAQIFAMGSTVIAFGLFIKPVGEALELSRATMNGGLVFWMVGFALGSPFVGKLVDKVQIRKVMVGGAMMMAAGFFLLSQLSSPLLMAIVLFLIIGPGSAALGPIACAKLVTNWFHRHCSKALGLSAVGASAGGVVLLPLITLVMDSAGWRNTLLVEAAMFLLLVCPLVWLLVITKPEECGLHMDGDSQPQSPVEDGTIHVADQWTFSALSKSPAFWMLVFGVGMMGVVGQAMLPTLIPYATDAGIDMKTASLLVSFWSAGAVTGKLVLGYLGDSLDKFYLFVVQYMIIIAVCSLMLGSPSKYQLITASVFGGVSTGAMLPLINGILADLYGRTSYGTVNGFLSPMMMLISMVGVWYIGDSYDSHGNYNAALQAFIALMVIAAILLLLVRKSRTSRASNAMI